MGLDPLRNKSFEKKNLLLLRRVLKLLATLNMIIGEINIITTTKHNHINTILIIHFIPSSHFYPLIFPLFLSLSLLPKLKGSKVAEPVGGRQSNGDKVYRR